MREQKSHDTFPYCDLVLSVIIRSMTRFHSKYVSTIIKLRNTIIYNTSTTSCPRVPSSKLSGIIALSTQWRRYYSIIILYTNTILYCEVVCNLWFIKNY